MVIIYNLEFLPYNWTIVSCTLLTKVLYKYNVAVKHEKYINIVNVLWCPLRFLHKNDVLFVFTSSCLYESSCLIYVICVCFRVVVSNAYCVVCFVFFFVLCTLYCQFLWIVLFGLPFRYFITFISIECSNFIPLNL